ncbi:MAG TPA: hypothetical protein VN924_33060 [Bryobacteraceae bacterium]|nr:hypothetical protein [Bryobacteraceae bacterium]
MAGARQAETKSRVLDRLYGHAAGPLPSALNGKPWHVAEMWRRFSESAGARQLPERFDHLAAVLYLHAEDPPLLPEQRWLVQKLVFRRKQQISTPLITSWEEQDPNFGRWVLGTLCSGEYGDFKIANNNHPRLNKPPSSVPPPNIEVHLCFGAGWNGAARAYSVAGFAALLIDDWRSALRPLDVSFHVHRLAPLPHSIGPILPGERWRDLQERRLPPTRAVGALFLRSDYGDLVEGPAWTPPPTRSGVGWWCASLLQDDLHELGFSPRVGRAGWFAQNSRLPAPVEHVILVPSLGAEFQFSGKSLNAEPEGSAELLRVRRENGGIALNPVRTRDRTFPTRHYLQLRILALDLLLDELWAKARQ